MYKRELIPCPICDSKQFKVVFTPWVDVDDPARLYGAASGIQGTQTIVRCSECRFVYENPRFPEDVILQGYMSSNEAGHDSQYSMRVNSFYRSLRSLAERIPKPGARVLDIGTAGGAFLDAAKRYGFEAVGLEPSQYLVESGMSRGLNIAQGTIANHKLPAESFDMVCLWDVIEHVVNPRLDLIHIRRLLKPDGILLINYPDIGTVPARLAGRRFWWILSVHLHHFDRHSIREVCKRSGFEAFYFQRYWQTLEFGYLEKMAAHLKVPLAATIERLTPNFIKRIPVPYYASQTTALARLGDLT